MDASTTLDPSILMVSPEASVEEPLPWMGGPHESVPHGYAAAAARVRSNEREARGCMRWR